jgi:hypothetical protein
MIEEEKVQEHPTYLCECPRYCASASSAFQGRQKEQRESKAERRRRYRIGSTSFGVRYLSLMLELPSTIMVFQESRSIPCPIFLIQELTIAPKHSTVQVRCVASGLSHSESLLEFYSRELFYQSLQSI